MRGVLEVGICGSYGGLNMGDEAILQVILAELRASGPLSATVFSRDAAHTEAHHDVARAVALQRLPHARLRDELARLDLLVLGGGGILFDGEASRFVRPALLAHELGVPVAVWAVGAGPLQQRRERARVRAALERAALVTVRDEGSQLLLEDVGVRRPIHVVADPAHLLPAEPFPADRLAEEGVPRDVLLVGVAVRGPGPAAPAIDGERRHELLAAAIDYLAARHDAFTLLVASEEDDLREGHAIAARLARPRRALVLRRAYGPGALAGLFGHLSFGIGMRLHFLVLAAQAGVPLLALSYGPKTDRLAAELDVPCVPVATTRPGTLIAALEHAFDGRDELAASVTRRAAEARARAARTAELAAPLLTAGRQLARSGGGAAERFAGA